MAITNQQRVGKAMDLLKEGLLPFISRELEPRYGKQWLTEVTAAWPHDFDKREFTNTRPLDAAVLLRIMWDQWLAVFKDTLGHTERSIVSELREARNKWAHQKPFTSDDTDRTLDSIARLLTAISAPQADEVTRMKLELRRLVYDEQLRGEKRKAGGSLIEATVSGLLKPWREVVTPHMDVASGRYQQAEFAADLWQVYMGEGTDEYKAPAEFFRRTFLTESLKRLLVGAVQRISKNNGDPVVQLQTNFGGGKTHSMLALYHLFSGVTADKLAGVDTVMANAGVESIPKAKRVVLVGNKISPGNPVKKDDGTVVQTLWGELAWQLGGKEAYKRIAEDDNKATSPGDALRELFNKFGPCLILIDEWVAYARQLHDKSDLPAGSFETQFTFAQALTESAKAAENCLLVISLPASDTAGSPHTQADDVEVGGLRGRDALDRLGNVVGRVESSWRPASAEEGFEIVRRRLFETLDSTEAFKQRDVTAGAFAELYRSQSAEFPPECRDVDYEKRIQSAFPIHPEIFDRLYSDWSTLVKFQRTRGVLRLMATVIHSLWEKGDKNPLILPSTIPIDDPRVQFELTRYLSDNWTPIIEKDVDGAASLPLKIDAEVPNLGKLHATRRIARTIYLGSAPSQAAAHRGLEDRRIKLGCVMPGESPAVFGDALRRLASSATYLYQDGPHFWYDTQPTVTKLAEDRAEQLNRDPDRVLQELEKRLSENLKQRGDFSRIYPMPRNSADVPDDCDARLVVLTADAPYTKEPGNPAETAARTILETRGNTPRIFRNTLVFLAADRVRLQDLDEALRKYLAWDSIIKEKDQLNLSPFQEAQAKAQLQSADKIVTIRLPETYQWLLAPEQSSPQESIVFNPVKLSGSDALAVRASTRLRKDELLVPGLGATILRKHMDDVPLWRGNHVSINQLVDDFCRYLYLPRLVTPEVLLAAIRDGIAFSSWQTDSFAYAESYDETTERYLGLRTGQSLLSIITIDSTGLLVKSDVAKKQIDAEIPPEKPESTKTEGGNGVTTTEGDEGTGTKPIQPTRVLHRYHGTVNLDPVRLGRDAGRIAEEVIAHLAGLSGAKVIVTLEIEASLPNGAPDNVVRTVTENGNSLKFRSHGFEEE